MASNKKAQYAIYKGKGGRLGALQFNLIPWNKDRKRGDKPSPSGFVLLEGARTVGEEDYDWANKISFALNENDIGQFIVGISKGCRIFHKYGNSVKTLELQLGNVTDAGLPTWKLYLNEQPDGGEKKTVFVPIASNEMAVLKKLLEEALPLMRGWDGEEERWGDETKDLKARLTDLAKEFLKLVKEL